MFLVCGEALFDLFSDNSDADPIPFEAHIGGSPFNVAVGLARLGCDVAFFGGISTDRFGRRLVDRLIEEGVDISMVPRIPALTTLAVVQRDKEGVPSYTFYGKDAADRLVTPEMIPELPEDVRIIHIGSFSCLVDPVASTIKELISRFRQNRLIAFDPNIRPTVVGDMDLWRTNCETLVATADLVKISSEDFGIAWPGQDLTSAIERWVSAGTALVIVTKGEDGAEAFTANHRISVPAKKITVVDSVGAGDSFQSSILANLIDLKVDSGKTLRTLDETALNGLLVRAIEASALTCTRRGADLPRRQDLTGLA